jgi:hypothetical protein
LKQAEAWRQWRAEAQHRAASRRIKERTRRVHIVAVSAEKRLLVVERGLRRSIANLRGEQPL